MDWTQDPRWWAALAAIAAIGVTICYKAIEAKSQNREAKRKLVRDRQQPLWDELRILVQPLPSLFQAAATELSSGEDLSALPTELADAPRRMGELGPRLQNPFESLDLELLSVKLTHAIMIWEHCLGLQNAVKQASDEIKAARAGNRPELADAWSSERESLVRRRDAGHREFAEQGKAARVRLAELIRRLDLRDRGLEPGLPRL